MFLNLQTWAIIALTVLGIAASTPVLAAGFRRRGKGVVYESNFMIQRAPQLASFINVLLICFSFLVLNNLFPSLKMSWVFSLGEYLPAAQLISWLGVAQYVSGLTFMIGGWYSLGDCFSTDAEVLEGHHVRNDGLLKFVMHPAYSGIIQAILGASIASLSPIAVIMCLGVVGPLWLNRAKYEEKLLIESLGDEYKKYGDELKWRRLVPIFVPFGV